MSKKYTYKQIGDTFFVSIMNHAEIMDALTEFVKECGITAGVISGLGAINKATLRFYNPHSKQYVDKTFEEQMEISNVTGNISVKDGKEYLHLHITIGLENYTTVAGHLLEATINGAGEFIVKKFDATINRYYDDETGLNLYDFR